MRLKTALVCAVISGLLLCFAFPPSGFGFLAWIALIPMVWVVSRNAPGRVFWLAWLSGCVFLGSTLYWIALHPDIPWPIMVLAVVVLAVFYAVPFVLSALMNRFSPIVASLLLPFAVTGVEWIRSFDQLAFPWMTLGNSQTCYPNLIQFADITSVFGVSFWIVSVNVTLFLLFHRWKSIFRWGLLAALFIFPAAYSWIVLHHDREPDRQLTVALIQGNVTPEEKWADGLEEWNINLYRSMSMEAALYEPDLIIWPETATPVYLADISSYRSIVQSLVDSIGIPILTGMPSIDFSTGETWNSAGLFVPGQSEVMRYDKLHLVPFGEAFPYDNIFPALRNIQLGQANWNEGSDAIVFDPTGLPQFNSLICFESIFPDLVRSFILRGSRFIVVITNDVWFGPNASPVQHAMISVMRAIEFHRPIARCANTGISMFIDRFGRIEGRTETSERTFLVGTINPADDMTFYGKYGNVFSLLCFMVSLGSLIVYFITKFMGSGVTGGIVSDPNEFCSPVFSEESSDSP